MVIIEGLPYDFDMVYFTIVGSKDIVSMPFVEALGILNNVSFDHRASATKTIEAAAPYFVIKGDTEKEKNKVFVVSKAELIKRLQLDIYEDKVRIKDLIIQPEGEFLNSDVRKFLNI